MCKNLLLGNGINLDLGISELYAINIFHRFQDILIKTSAIYEYIFGKGFDEQICQNIFADCIKNPKDTAKIGIESLAKNVYDYIKKENDWSDNAERDLIDCITVSAINAIFYNGTNIIDTAPVINDNNSTKISILQSYNNVFSLNYTEFWDTTNICSFLHGKYTLPKLSSTGKNIILFNSYYDKSGNYNKLINQLSNSYTMIKYVPDVVFTPLLDKQDSLYVGHCPSPTLFPGFTTFPSAVSELYTALDNIDSLDIFGISPFGDDNLIEKLSAIPDLTIYVYKKDKDQVNKWNGLLKRECCIDSSLFYKK